MSVKKAKKPARSVRYLLSADRRLQKLSLRKISERENQAKPSTRARRTKQADSHASRATAASSMGGRLAVAAVVCMVGAAALIAARQPATESSASAIADATAQTLARETRLVPVPHQPATAVVSKTSDDDPLSKPKATSMGSQRTTAPAPAKPVERARPIAASAAAAPVSAAAVDKSSPVTVEGCLEADRETYRLTGTSGVRAPRTRSWRTGFLMKQSSTIEIADARSTLGLKNHVGERVAVTGTLVDRKMHAQRLRIVAAACR